MKRATSSGRSAPERRRSEGGMAGTAALFAYGTLEDPALLRQVTGRSFARTAAVLHGYARYRVRGRPYPAVVEEPAARTDGTLYLGLDEGALALVDLYEADLYERRRVAVTAADGTRIAAYTYVVRESRRGGLSTERWDRDRFLERARRAAPDRDRTGTR